MNRRPAAALCSASLAFLLLPTIEAAAAGIPDVFTQARTYAFAACVMERYADTPLAAEAGVWASGIIENGDLPFERSAEIAALVKHAPPPGVADDVADLEDATQRAVTSPTPLSRTSSPDRASAASSSGLRRPSTAAAVRNARTR